MKRISLNVDVAEASDLLRRVPRACVALADDGEPRVEPADVVFDHGRYLVGMQATVASHVTSGDEVVLLIDEGFHFFDLRAVYVRGHVALAGEGDGLPGDLCWFEITPTRSTAWNYARIRELDDEA